MITIKNVLLHGDTLSTVLIKDGYFEEIIPQNTVEPSKPKDICLDDFANLSSAKSSLELIVNAAEAKIFPAAIDPHVHSRDPGLTHKEDWSSLAKAAFKGGVIAVVDMPNTIPPTMNKDQVIEKMEIASKSGLDYRILLGVGKGNVTSLKELLRDNSLPICGVKIYYGKSTGDLIFNDLEELEKHLPENYKGRLVFHSEDQCRIDQRVSMLQNDLNRANDASDYRIHSNIRDSQSAWNSTEEILSWANKHGKKIHLAHVSTPKEVELLWEIKQRGLGLSSEVSPHHLLFSDADYDKLGPFLKVNPPVRSKKEVDKLREYVSKGMIECFATDHAPHTVSEKKQPYALCPSGIPSIEFFWPLLFKIARICNLPVKNLIPMVTTNSSELFGFERIGKISRGYRANFVWIEEENYLLRGDQVAAKCGWSPYVGMDMVAKVRATWKNAQCVYFEN